MICNHTNLPTEWKIYGRDFLAGMQGIFREVTGKTGQSERKKKLWLPKIFFIGTAKFENHYYLIPSIILQS